MLLFGLDPILYDHLVRRFQSSQERDDEVKGRETSSILEAGFSRAESRLNAAQSRSSTVGDAREEYEAAMAAEGEVDDEPKTKENGWDLWVRFMTRRFVEGRDEEFEYANVDDDANYDVGEYEHSQAQEEYFEQEEAGHVPKERATGETGIQDY